MNEARCALHPANAAVGPCTRCGTFVCELCVQRKPELYCPTCGPMIVVGRGPTAWEQRDTLGALPALWATWRESVLHPDTFFRRVKPDGSLKDALLYGWFLQLLVVGPNILFQALNFEQMKQSFSVAFHGVPHWMENISRFEWGAMLALPGVVIYPLTLLMTAGLIHLGCLVWGANKNGFNATARAMAYSQGPAVVAAMPVVGWMAGLYCYVLMVFGIARGQEVTGARAAGAVLSPILLISCCAGVGITATIVAALANR